ncbi:retrovirus-related pol polyprotein from transposon TNT 1-94 [Tanacetum coccineum]|uniref:Retrovirus-related pol polyprotein from transposon TNT 1-94 n=1 Tax=Tanacetum coccineum TaxID=301880 RepID=A0ABQ5F1S8_9ASTR
MEADGSSYFKPFSSLPEDIYALLDIPKQLTPEWSRHVTIVHQTKDLHTTDYTQLYDFLKYNQKEVDDQRAERLAKTHDPLALMANSNNPFNLSLNAGQNVGYQNGYNAVQNVGNQVVQDAVQNQGVQNVGNQNGQIVVPGITNQNPNGNGNVVAALGCQGNSDWELCNQIRCYNCRGLGHLAKNCTVRPRRRDAAYLQTQLLIAQKEEVGIQLQAKEFDLMAAAADLDEIKEVNANCILMANLPQATTTEIHKILKEEIFPIINQVDTRLQNFEIQFLKEAAKFVRDFKSLAKEADESLLVFSKAQTLELEIERLFKAVWVKNANMTKFRTIKLQRHANKSIDKDGCKLSWEDQKGKSQIPPSGVDNTAKTRRPQPRSNTKNDRVPSASKSSCNKNKEVEVEEHHRNLLLSKNKKHMSSECKHVKLDIRNDKSEVICAMCKQCLITANHDVCMLNYVNDMNSRGKKQKAIVSNTENQKKQKSKVIKPKKVGSNERLASPKPSKPRFCLRWSPTGRLFDIKGKIIASSESESQSDCSNGYPNLFMVRRLGLLQAYDREPKASHQFRLEVFGNFGQFCDSDLEVAFRRNSCFVRTLEGVDLLKGNRSTNLYTINLHEMASASPICLMARATSTKSWLWHQRLSHLNFDTINDLAKNDLVTGLPKFKYHKEHLCPSCEQGKSKRASHPPKPVPNSKQRLHLLHMDLCGPMRIASINGKRYVLVIVDDYSRYTWVHFLRSKDEAPEVIKTFLKRITVLLQSPVIIIRTDNGTEFKNQILKEYFDSVGISHQASSVDTSQMESMETKKTDGSTTEKDQEIMETMNVTFRSLSAMAFEQKQFKIPASKHGLLDKSVTGSILLMLMHLNNTTQRTN